METPGIFTARSILLVGSFSSARELLDALTGSQSDLEIIPAQPDEALRITRSRMPDLILLDIELPRMEGLVFLERLMRENSPPCVVITSDSKKSSYVTLNALDLGAVDFVFKPVCLPGELRDEYSKACALKLRLLTKARPKTHVADHFSYFPVKRDNLTGRSLSPMNSARNREKVIAVGAATGGPVAVKELLASLPVECPGIVVTLQMPASFTRTFAERLNGLCTIKVKEAEDGEPILPGHAYIAPGDRNLLVDRSGGGCRISLATAPLTKGFFPSIDVMFRSAAAAVGKNAIGIIMTGMGDCGAAGMLELHRAGAHTIAQDESSCLFFGMPQSAIAMGGVNHVVPLADIPRHLITYLTSATRPPSAAGTSERSGGRAPAVGL